MTESLFRRLLLRFALVPAVALCLFLGVLGLWLHRISVYRTMTADATATLLASNHLSATMIDEESGVRGYLLTHDTKFLDPYRAAANRLDAERNALVTVVADDPDEGARVANIVRNFRDFDALNAALLRPGLSAEAANPLLTQQKAAMDRLRVEFAGLTAIENGYRDRGRHAVNELFRRLPALGIGGGVLVALLLIWHGIYLFREITTAFRRQLAESEAQRDSLHTTLQSIGDAVIVCDRRGRITLLNPTAEQLTGWTTAHAMNQPLDYVYKTIDGVSRGPIESPIANLERLGTIAEPAKETLLLRPDGAEIPIDDRGAPIRDARGQLIGIILVFRSVAERKETEQALRESEARFQAIYATSLEHIGILNPAGKILDVNRASLAFADSKREDVVGLSFWDGPWFAHTRGAAEFVRAAVSDVARGQVVRTELRLRRAAGDWITFDFSLAPVLDAQGKVLFVVPEARDISELKRADEALRASEERLRIATETARLGTWELDLRTGLMQASGICREHFGRSPNDQFIYRDLLSAIHPEDRARREAAVQRAIEEDSVYRLEYRAEWPDGSLHWILASGRSMRDGEGMNVRMIGVTIDVTERRQAEAALLQSEKLAAVGRLAATIAHEINNPLESVTNLLYLARMGKEIPEVYGHLDLAERELRRVSVITTQTLRFHKQSSGPRAVTAAELFESVLLMYQSRFASRHILLQQRERARQPIVCLDGEIRQVLNNLVGNALDALEPQGGELFLRTREGTEWKSERRGIVVTIADTGGGIPHHMLRKIFDPFFSTKGASGTGLGLWVSKEIVDRHNGVLRVRSQPQPGSSWTVFSLFLPFAM